MEVEHYKKAIFSTGIIPVLMALATFEEQENFEECKKIKEAIDCINSLLEKHKLPTRLRDISPELVGEVMAQLKVVDIPMFWYRMRGYMLEILK